ncbi:uncharacterized protein LOC105187078 [Harpegnathos saltator]|uniref:uncharacterized protein LOC105187078 n=1 Tax=Harpegnathos saltator TaxID=610380 RepID=UPI000DBEDA4D|nr:uncharacterized protein LOC105187078 [Harpegnathos saltator]
METTFVDKATISYVQNLAKCDITKEELTDAIEYLRDVLIQFPSSLVDSREVFYNVNQICFPPTIHSQKCICAKNYAFITCSWCKKLLCFTYFYTAFHPQSCDSMTTFYNT